MMVLCSRNLALIPLLVAASLAAAQPGPARPCEEQTFEDAKFIICTATPGHDDLRLFWKDAHGEPYRRFPAIARAVADEGRMLLFAMNAGMYQTDFSPIGLYVENGKELRPASTTTMDGPTGKVPNFFKKPNGVFFVRKDGSAGVEETGAYAAAAHTDVAYATQSGPMLVIDGKIHPRFEPDGTSRFIRNGVGVRADGTVVLAISRQLVSLGSFARLFLDELSCPNALFLDGAISTLSDGQRILVGGKDPVGPILAVRKR